MLDLRYHVASLSAVFLALVIGILVGVGISGRGFVDKSERRNFENRISALQSRVDQLGAQNALLAQQGQAEHTFVQDTYPVLMRDRLKGKRIGVIVIGPAGRPVGDVRQALADAGGTLSLYRVLKVPIAPAAVRRALAKHPGFQTPEAVGHELAQEWATQGVTPIADVVSPLIVEEQRGGNGKALDGIVIVGAVPTDPPTAQLVAGMFDGFAAASIPAVGAERIDTVPSAVPAWGQMASLSTVDDVDTPSGKFALTLLLAGAARGHYGVKPAAEAPLPRVEPAG
ncbi:MAG: copper transporter [Gaiellaceae bacterium]